MDNQVPLTTSDHQFMFGFVIVTAKAFKRLSHIDVFFALLRHLRGSYGDLGPCDMNEEDCRLVFLLSHYPPFRGTRCDQWSAFRDRSGTRFCILSLADHSTVILLPEEY